MVLVWGGYAISAYSNILNLDRILLYSPISTLNENILTFDKNHYIDNEAWITYSLDGAETNASGYIIYDPLYEADNKHASRYSKKLEHLRVSGVGHIVIKHIADLGMAKWIFRSFVMGKIDKETFKIKIMGLASHSI